MSLVFIIYSDCDAFYSPFIFNDMTVADEAQRPVPCQGSTADIEQLTLILIKHTINKK